jgi:glycosyltransferase involved in cell wall biosynthesis
LPVARSESKREKIDVRVLVVTIVHHPEDARIRHRQIRSLLDAGHDVVYVAPFTECAVALPSDVTAVDVPRAVGRRRSKAIRAARREIRTLNPGVDLVLLHDPELLLSVWGLRGLPPVVWDVHEDTAAAVTLKPWLPRLARRLAALAVSLLERRAEREHHLLLAESSYLARFRRAHPVVPNTTWVPGQVPPPGADRVVYLGHLTRARGAVEMVELGRVLGATVTLELIGTADDEVRPLLEEADRTGDLVWRGFVPNDIALRQVEGALAGLSLLHDEPNYRHSKPTKVIEYMARGVPAISTPTLAAQELLEEHRAGIVVPFDDVTAVVDGVKRLHDDPALRVSMGRNGHRAAVDHYAWPVQAGEFLTHLEKWAAQGRRRPKGPHPRRSRRIRTRRR